MTEVIDLLKRDELIPTLLPESFVPSEDVTFSIVYPRLSFAPGQVVQLALTADEPQISITFANDSGNALYTLAMLDPDAPSRADPKFRSWRHWVITGLKPGKPYAIRTKPATTPYRAPKPPPGSGLHRYAFFLFREPESSFTISVGAAEYGDTLEQRRKWNATEFAKKYGLQLVGVTYFLTESSAAL
ncbi:PEBP-like protein [Fistulina hepatica ATCC 64428]|uniref:PEBP-like protein n=1 Tax=Fistulina hepatica ATCC 64428 TaxID=1128425 RepID=A0A0D7ADD4_9AGAR|nr:PEBP-like protein [Fistulina hepatica ATCC 64428]